MTNSPDRQSGSTLSDGAGAITAAGRLLHLDMMRGLALFGILLINAQQMFQPFFFSNLDYANAPVGVVAGEAGAVWNWAILYTLFDTKFITLFSLLFGIGFALQIERAQKRAMPFAATYLRRLFVLVLFGIIHAMLFYPADVLVSYAITGALFFFIARNWGPALLFQVGLILFLTTCMALIFMFGPTPSFFHLLVVTSLMIIAGILSSVTKMPLSVRTVTIVALAVAALTFHVNGSPDAPPEHALAEIQETANAVTGAFHAGSYEFGGNEYDLPLDPAALDTVMTLDSLDNIQTNIIEQSIMRAGPPAAYFERGLSALGLIQVFGVLYLYWRTFALFALGAALMKWGLLKVDSRFAKPAMVCGLGLGLPMAMLASWMQFNALQSELSIWSLSEPLHSLSALLMAIGIVGMTMRWSQTGFLVWIQEALAALGRMALTNYISQSACLAFVSTWYGMSLVGSLSRWDQTFVCFGIFGMLLLVSRLWLLLFEYGPLEWIWRTLTYGRFARLLRNSGTAEASR